MAGLAPGKRPEGLMIRAQAKGCSSDVTSQCCPRCHCKKPPHSRPRSGAQETVSGSSPDGELFDHSGFQLRPLGRRARVKATAHSFPRGNSILHPAMCSLRWTRNRVVESIGPDDKRLSTHRTVQPGNRLGVEFAEVRSIAIAAGEVEFFGSSQDLHSFAAGFFGIIATCGGQSRPRQNPQRPYRAGYQNQMQHGPPTTGQGGAPFPTLVEHFFPAFERTPGDLFEIGPGRRPGRSCAKFGQAPTHSSR